MHQHEKVKDRKEKKGEKEIQKEKHRKKKHSKEKSEKNRSVKKTSKKKHIKKVPSLLQLGAEPFYLNLEDFQLNKAFRKGLWTINASYIQNLYESCFGYEIYLANDETAVPLAEDFPEKTMFLVLNGKHGKAYFILSNEFTQNSHLPTVIQNVKVKLNHEEQIKLHEASVQLAEELILASDDEEKEKKKGESIIEEEQNELKLASKAIKIEKNAGNKLILEKLMVRIIVCVLDKKMTDTRQEETKNSSSAGKEGFFDYPEITIDLAVKIKLISRLLSVSEQEIIKQVKKIFEYLIKRTVDKYPVSDHPCFEPLLYKLIDRAIFSTLSGKLRTSLLEAAITVLSSEELRAEAEDGDAFVDVKQAALKSESTCTVLERAYLVAKMDENHEGNIRYLGSYKMDTCIAIILIHRPSGRMVIAHVPKEVSIPRCVMTLLREFQDIFTSDDGSEKILEIRLCGGTTEENRNYDSEGILTELMLYFLIAAQHLQITLWISRSDIFSKLLDYRKKHEKKTDDFTVGNLVDRQGRGVFVNYRSWGLLPFTDCCETPILGKEGNKNIWFTLLHAFQVESGCMIKVYDDVQENWNDSFLQWAEKKLKKDFAKRLFEKSFNIILLPLQARFMKKIIIENLYIWVEKWQELYENTVIANKTQLFENYPFTYHYLQYIASKILISEGKESKVLKPSANEIKYQIFNLLIESGIIKDKVFNAIFLQCEQLLQEESAESIMAEKIIDLLRQFCVSPWHLFDELNYYEKKSQYPSTNNMDLSAENNVIFAMIKNPDNIETIIKDWHQELLEDALEEIIKKISRGLAGHAEEFIDFIKEQFQGYGVQLLPLVHEFSLAQPLLVELIASIKGIISHHFSQNDRAPSHDVNEEIKPIISEEVKSELTLCISSWFGHANASVAERVNENDLLEVAKEETISHRSCCRVS
jgi:hypothetical protein